MNKVCYYCKSKATKIIAWSKERVYSCDKCSEKATGKVISLNTSNKNHSQEGKEVLLNSE